MQNVSEEKLNGIRRARRGLEVDIAKTIGKYLIDVQKEYIRNLTVTMLDKILSLFDKGHLKLHVETILLKQTCFAMWSLCAAQPTYEGLLRVKECVIDYKPSLYGWLNVCSDVIRLFGELAEDKQICALPDKDWKTMQGKGALRPEPIYAKPEKSKEGWGHRHRSNKPDPVRIGKPFIDLPREAVEWRGAERFSFGEHSVISIIDWTYGLQIEGGDVSGTTTDSIAALNWAASEKVNPIAQLIAIATMVPQGHHTIVECAWPLTRHGYMDYKIGFYDTLIPEGTEYGQLRKLLKNLDNDARNQHVIVCFDDSGKLKMNYLFDKHDEKNEYKRIAGVRSAYSFCVGGKTNVKSVANMMKAHGVREMVIDRLFYWVGRS
jgi:hypothetical protein